MELDEFRPALDRWLDEHADELAPDADAGKSLDGDMAQLAKVKRLTYDAGWMRWGWPERVGGLGGSTLLRGYLGEALTARDLVEAGISSLTEVLAPTMIDYASPELAAEMVPRLLRGDETWCQGFSEPDTGSNLAALACRATLADDEWRVSGQKVWTSLAQYAQRCVLLVRTGSVEDAHRGISALFVDMDTPGITVRPDHDDPWPRGVLRGVLRRGRRPDQPDARRRRPGLVGRHGPVAVRAQHGALAPGFLPAPPARPAVGVGARRRVDPAEVGAVFQQLFAFRSRSRATQYRLASGGRLGPETSVDKILLATNEQAVFDLAADALADEVLAGRRRSERALAFGVPLLAVGDDLRRQRRDPAEHRRPPPARPGGGPMTGSMTDSTTMDDDERDLFVSALRQAANRRRAARRSTRRSTRSGGRTRWRPTVGPRRRRCSSCRVSRARPRSALGLVMLDALGVARPGAVGVVLPPLRSTGTPGGVDPACAPTPCVPVRGSAWADWSDGTGPWSSRRSRRRPVLDGRRDRRPRAATGPTASTRHSGSSRSTSSA